MKVTIETELQPFSVPNFVLLADSKPDKRQDGFNRKQSIALADLTPSALAAMCDQFRADAFAKAGMTDPTP